MCSQVKKTELEYVLLTRQEDGQGEREEEACCRMFSTFSIWKTVK